MAPWRSRFFGVAAAAASLASLVAAQETPPKKDPEAPKDEKKFDQTDTVGDALRRLFGEKNLQDPKKGIPKKDVPPKPEPTTRKSEQEPEKKQAPAKEQEPQDRPSTKPSEKPKEKPVNPTDEAARALQKILGESARPVIPRPPDGVKLKPVDPAMVAKAAREAPSTDVELKPEGVPVSGSLYYLYRFRRGEDDRMQDMRAMVGFDIGDAQRHAVTGKFLARGYVDMDQRGPTNELNGIEQTFESRWTGRIYDAFVEYHEADAFDVVRLGRQTISETPEQLFLDGLRLESKPMGQLRNVVGVYAGMPVRLFESMSGDFAAGANLTSQLPGGTRVRLDYMYVEDEQFFGPADNELFSVGVWQQVSEHSHMYARYSMLEGKNRDLLLRGSTTIPDWELDLRASYYDLLEPQGSLVNEFDPYYEAALTYYPFRQVSASATAPVYGPFDVDLGFDMRRVHDTADEGQFNREYERWFGSLVWSGFLIESVDLTVTGEWFDTVDGEDVEAFELDLTGRPTESLRWSLGSSYSLYKYDFVTQKERDHVRTYYAAGEYRWTQALRLRLNYALETGPFGDFHTMEAMAQWTF